MLQLTLEMIQDRLLWESFITTRPEANFLQSWNWGVFHQKLGKTVRYWVLKNDQQIVGGGVCVKEKAKRGTYLSLAGGPLLNWSNREQVEFFFHRIREYAQAEGCFFVRFRPQALDAPELRQMMSELGILESPMHVTADLTLQLDLGKSEEELLADMRKNTRYDIRRSAKEGIVVRTSTNLEDIRLFYEQQVALAKKHHFVPFGYSFLFEQFSTFAADGQAILFHAFQQDQLLASAFVLIYNREAVYHYGISTPANDRLPGSYACQWAAIQWAKAQGCLRYNFWGIAPLDQPDHRFSGVSLFKRGFGGQEIAYLPAHDLPVHWQYSITRFFEQLRKKWRKL